MRASQDDSVPLIDSILHPSDFSAASAVAFAYALKAALIAQPPLKAELMDHVAERVQLPTCQTETVINLVLQDMMDALRAGGKVELQGFGRRAS